VASTHPEHDEHVGLQPEVELESICRIFETAGQIWALQGSMVVLRNEHDGKHSNRGNTANATNATNTFAHTP
jgi:hypothetical protein